MGYTDTQNQIATFTTNLANYLNSDKGTELVGAMGKALKTLGDVYQDEELVAPINVAASEIIRHIGSAVSQILEVVHTEANKVEENEKLMDAFKTLKEKEGTYELNEFAKAMENLEDKFEDLQFETILDKE